VEQFAGRASGAGGGGKIIHHAFNLTDSAELPRSFFRKKNGRRK